jgi:hypothetical protein
MKADNPGDEGEWDSDTAISVVGRVHVLANWRTIDCWTA